MTLRSDINFMWNSVKDEKNWLKISAPKNKIEEQIFFRFDHDRNCLIAYHHSTSFFNITQSYLEEAEKYVKKASQRKENEDLVFDFDMRRYVTHVIFSDYMLPRKKK